MRRERAFVVDSGLRHHVTDPHWRRLSGIVVPGYGVASGHGANVPFDGGSLRFQFSHFEERGVDLADMYLGTINVSIEPLVVEYSNPAFTISDLEWYPDYPAETFSISHCRLHHAARVVDGYLYYPHAETKVQHFHPPHTVEVIAPFIDGVRPGIPVALDVDTNEVTIR